jgi:hypothetical protein
MDFTRYRDARTERMEQIAAMLCRAYTPLREHLPPIIAEKLERLERTELCSSPPSVTNRV